MSYKTAEQMTSADVQADAPRLMDLAKARGWVGQAPKQIDLGNPRNAMLNWVSEQAPGATLTPRMVSEALGMPIQNCRDHLTRFATEGLLTAHKPAGKMYVSHYTADAEQLAAVRVMLTD